MKKDPTEKKDNLKLVSGHPDNLLQKFVRWTEDGRIYRGTVIDVFIRQGVRYLDVMTIFGTKRSVSLSKVKFIKFKDQL